MISYKGQLNEGNAALGTEKTITANEDIRTCDLKALAREINHQNALIPEDVAASVLGYFCKAAVQRYYPVPAGERDLVAQRVGESDSGGLLRFGGGGSAGGEQHCCQSAAAKLFYMLHTIAPHKLSIKSVPDPENLSSTGCEPNQ